MTVRVVLGRGVKRYRIDFPGNRTSGFTGITRFLSATRPSRSATPSKAPFEVEPLANPAERRSGGRPAAVAAKANPRIIDLCRP